MSRDVTTAFTEEKNKSLNQPLYLYTVVDYDSAGTNLYFTNSRTAKTYNSTEYQPFPVTHEHISENTSGEIEAVNVKLGNVSRLIQSYLEEYDLRGKEVIITLVWLNHLDDSENFTEDSYFIDQYTADANNVVFTCTSKLDIMDLQLPSRNTLRNHCSWLFKSDECGYAGGDTECDNSLQECRLKGNQARFGGFPNVPNKGLYI